MATTHQNPVGIEGIAFIEFASPTPKSLEHLFLAFGFSKTHENGTAQASWFSQNEIHCIVNEGNTGHGPQFSVAHGPSIPAMGWYAANPAKAFAVALERGAKPATLSTWCRPTGEPIPAIEGIGGSLIYFVEKQSAESLKESLGFTPAKQPILQSGFGFCAIDHLTNNVEKGTMQQWSEFYQDIFGFTQVRYFDIRGVKTGLTSYALRSPCGTFCIPINEGTEDKSQINEYLREYRGPGIQHLAFSTSDIVTSIRELKSHQIETLDIDDEYYQEVFQRVPNVTEDHKNLQKLGILVDGDSEGYLLQIFTKNLIGPIFIEIIQRKNHLSFGEGNFQALFRSLERDQERRGVL